MQKQQNDRGLVRWFLSYYRPHLGLFILDMLCASCIAGVDLFFPIMSRDILNTFIPDAMYSEFFTAIIFILIAYVLRSVMMFIVTYYGHKMGVLIEADMRRDLFSHVQTMSFSFFDKTRTGQVMSRILNDLFDITELAHHGPEDLFISLITLIGAFIVLVNIQWKLAVTIFAVIPLLILFTVRQRKRMHAASINVRERMAGINSELESSISGARVAQAFANESYEAEKFAHGNERFKSAKNMSYKAMGVFHSGMEFCTAMMPLIVIALGGYFIMKDSMKLEDLITFNLFVATFVNPIRKLANFVEQYTSGMAGFSRFAEMMNAESEIKNSPDARPLKGVRGDIELKDVCFSYDEGANVLHNINLKVEPGMTLALVGPSGGGKTTLCHLIPRFYDVQSGEVLVDGQHVKHIDLHSLRQNIGIVQQDVFLFAGTVKDNIRYGRVDATDEEIIVAAKQAEIHDDIMNMADGYDTMVGERGVTLSGGQKQRISIARIFLKNPPILILDEATSSLDTQTEARIQNSFDKLAEGRTTMVIAHRLSTIKNADKIAVIDDDGIVEMGTHNELLALGGVYSALYEAGAPLSR